MTQERDFDRIARAWLETGPNEAPDRAVAAVLAASATTPQMRQTWRWPVWRPITMTPRTFSLIGALVIALVIGTTLAVGQPGPRPSPTPTAGASATPFAASASGPSTGYQPLVGTWIGRPKTLSTLQRIPILRASFAPGGQWDPVGSGIEAGSYQSMIQVSGDQITVVAAVHQTACAPGDVGTYRFATSPGEDRFSTTLISDPCDDRSTLFAGDWVHDACTTPSQILGPDGVCYGDLEQGTYRSPAVDLRDDVAAGSVPPIDGALTFTVPPGWAHVVEDANRFWLMKSVDYTDLDSAALKDASIYVFGKPKPASEAEGCPGEAQPGVGTSVDDLTAFVTRLPGIRSSAPTDITINGRHARWFDIRVDPSWTTDCPWTDGVPAVPYVYANSGIDYVAGPARDRVVFVDIGHGDTVLIQIHVEDPTRFDAFAADAMPIIQSFEFAEPTPS